MRRLTHAITIGYRVEIEKLHLPDNPPADLTFRVVSGPTDLAALSPRMQALNSEFKGVHTIVVDQIAVAEDATGGAQAYWCLRSRGDDLIESGVYVAASRRGQSLALHTLAALVRARPHTRGALRTRVLLHNKSSRRMMRKLGMRPSRVSISARVPVVGRLGLWWGQV